MKIIREHINEKFKKDSDPIEDMGIGIKHRLDKWIKEVDDEWGYIGDINIQLRMAAYYGKLDFAEYLLNIGADIHTSNQMPLINAVRNEHKDVTKLLIERGADIREAYDYMHNKEDRQFLINCAAELNKFVDIDENVNEKFVEDSDPIRDLNVGKVYLIQNWFVKDLKLSEESYAKNVVVKKNNEINLNVPASFDYIRDRFSGNFPDFIQFHKTLTFTIRRMNITTLRGCPHYVYGDFDCSGNELTSLDHCPKKVTGDFICENNSVKFTEEDVRARCKVGGEVIV